MVSLYINKFKKSIDEGEEKIENNSHYKMGIPLGLSYNTHYGAFVNLANNKSFLISLNTLVDLHDKYVIYHVAM